MPPETPPVPNIYGASDQALAKIGQSILAAVRKALPNGETATDDEILAALDFSRAWCLTRRKGAPAS